MYTKIRKLIIIVLLICDTDILNHKNVGMFSHMHQKKEIVQNNK